MLPPDLVAGKRHTGKSFFIRWILYSCRDYWPRGFIFSKTIFNGYWNKLIPKRFQFDKWDPTVVYAIMEQQKALTAYVEENPDCGIDPRIFIILDDCVDEHTRYDPVLNQLYLQSRHFNIWLIQTSQYLKLLPPAMRTNIDLVISFVQLHKGTREVIAEDFMSDLPKEYVMAMFDSLVPPRGAMPEEQDVYKGMFIAFNQRNNERNAFDRVYFGKASEPPKFLLGSRTWWGDEISQVIETN